MHVEVDQSGKIGTTRVPTVLAFANTKQYAILIPSSVKRDCLKLLRTSYRALRQPYMKLFAASLFLLLKPHLIDLQQIVIDQEYPGQEATIKGILLNYIRREIPQFPRENIVFKQIGKQSHAHEKAYRTFRREEAPDRIIQTKELVAILGK